MNQSILSPLATEPDRQARGVSGRGSEDTRSNLLELVRVIYRGKWKVLAIALLLTIPAVLYVFQAAPTYRSSTLLFIEQNKNRPLSLEEAIGSTVGSREYILTQTEFIRSRNVLDRVIENLGLDSHPEFDPRARPASLARRAREWVQAYLGITGTEAPWTQEMVREAVHDVLARRLEVQPVRLSQLIRIGFEAGDPTLAAAVADAVAEAYIQADMDAQYETAVQTNAWVNEQGEKVRANLAASEKVLQAYRDSKGFIDKQSEAQGGAGKQLEALTQRLVEARVRRSQAEQALAQVRAGSGRSSETAPAVMADPNVSRAREARARAQLKVAELSEHYGQAHPLYQAAAAELAAANASVSQTVEAVVAGVGKEFAMAKAIEDSLVDAIEQFQKSIRVQNRDEFQLANYEREVNSNKMLLETFLARAKETSVAISIRSASGRVVDKAVPSLRPVKPQKVQITAVALFLGALVGVALVVFRHRLDQTIDSVEAAEEKLGQPVLAAVPKLSARKASVAYHMMEAEPDSHFSEAIRTIRTSIMLSGVDRQRKVIAVTSSVAGEGKSTIAFNLGVALSQTGKTVFVECDMRRPRLARSNEARMGLSEVLADRAGLGECLAELPGSDLRVLAAGSVPRNPLEMLSSRRFQAVVKELSAEFDVVVLDTPPVAVVSDAMITASLATCVIFVVQAAQTPRTVIRRSLDLLSKASADILGVVLNQMDFRHTEIYYRQYSSGNQGGYSACYEEPASSDLRKSPQV